MCGSCVEKLTPSLNANNEIRSWKVDTGNSNKILTIETETLTPEMIATLVKNAGYNVEPLAK